MTMLYKDTCIKEKSFAYKVSLFAVRSLYKEVSLSYKPGLVSFLDQGSHQDMDAKTFMRSIFSLRTYFKKITMEGMNNSDFVYLQNLGIEAERKMFKTTNGINTHKGAIFSLGIMCAGAGLLYKKRININALNLSSTISKRWSKDILNLNNPDDKRLTNGERVKNIYGYKGVRFEAAHGFLSTNKRALPILKSSFKILKDEDRSLIQTLFFIMKELDDTNLVHRGGKKGLEFAKNISSSFIKKGGVFQDDWKQQVVDIHKEFVSKNLSPGGSADLLALCYFVYILEKEAL